MTKIPIDEISLHWHCYDCGYKTNSPLLDMVEVGTAICPECDIDMELDEFVTRHDE